MNAPLIGAVVAAVAAGAVAAAQETVGVNNTTRPVGEIIQIITAVGVLAGIIGGIIVQIVTLRIRAAVAPVVASVAAVEAKADVIKSSVDGTASRMEATLAAVLRENERLVAASTAQKQEQVAAVLAATQAIQVTDPAAVKTGVVGHLQQIEANTEATANNTARTDAAVAAIKKE